MKRSGPDAESIERLPTVNVQTLPAGNAAKHLIAEKRETELVFVNRRKTPLRSC